LISIFWVNWRDTDLFELVGRLVGGVGGWWRKILVVATFAQVIVITWCAFVHQWFDGENGTDSTFEFVIGVGINDDIHAVCGLMVAWCLPQEKAFLTKRKAVASQAYKAIANYGLGLAPHASIFMMYRKAASKIRYLNNIKAMLDFVSAL